jgi:hypothetical protein
MDSNLEVHGALSGVGQATAALVLGGGAAEATT